MLSDLPACLLTGRPFTCATATGLGVSTGVVRGPLFRQVLRGVHVHATSPDSLFLRLEAALLLVPHGWVTQQTAALLLGAPADPDGPVHLGVLRGQPRCRVRGLLVHKHRYVPELARVDGRLCVSAVTAFQQMSVPSLGMTLEQLVSAGDAFVRRGRCSAEELRRACRTGSPAAYAAGFVRAGVDSPPETRLRLLLVLTGLPEPLVNQRVLDGDGEWVARPDLAYPAQRIAIEYEGDHHRTDRRQWARDIARQELLEAQGWLVLRVTARDLFSRPAITATRVLEALHRRGHPNAPAHVADGLRAALD